MENLDKFIEDVKKELTFNFNSYCPQCYGVPAILNSHKCREGWEIWYNNSLSYKTKVKLCVAHINKISYSKEKIPLIYNSLGEMGSRGPDDSGIRLDIPAERKFMSERKELFLILTYTLFMIILSIFVAYHSPIECDSECQESYYD